MRTKVCSKKDLIFILAIEGQYHLPAPEECSLHYLRECMAGRKKLFKNREVNVANVPRLKEFRCETMWQYAMSD